MDADGLAQDEGRLGLPQRAALSVLRAYQLIFSPLFAGSCRYLPSCSTYATIAVRRFGVVRGSWLAARRLARCHPLGGHGLDPVPDRRSPALGRRTQSDSHGF